MNALGTTAGRSFNVLWVALLAGVMLVFGVGVGHTSPVYSLRNDWSEVSNPNGVWALRAGTLLLVHVPDWKLAGWTYVQPGWAAQNLPFWFKSAGAHKQFPEDWKPGDIVVHTQDDYNGRGNGQANLTWTSPVNGEVDIAGGVWICREIGRGNRWRLSIQGSEVSSGEINSGDQYSRANPFTFDRGSGGPPALQGVQVKVGDVVGLEIVRTSPAGDFVGVEFTVTVREGIPPTLATVANQTINELATLSLTLSASDIDQPAQTMTFSLVSGPSGLSVSSTGVVSWIPTEAQGPSTNTVMVKVTDSGSPALSATNQFQVIVREVNSVPVLAIVANQTINELATLSAALSASDSDVPSQTLTFSLVSGPNGLSVSSTGVVTWTPTEAQGPSTNTVMVKVTDSGSPALSATNQFQVIVREVNSVPVLAIVANQTINELASLTLTLSASDDDLPAQALTFGPVSGPGGLSVSPAGLVTWAPNEAQGPSTNTVVMKVTDSGTPALSATNQFQVIVREVNSTPVLATVANQTLDELTPLSVALSASDSDVPSQTLTFALVSGPNGLSVSPAGVVTWTPTEAQGPSTNTVVVKVTDSGSPALSATNQFQVIVREVNAAPVFATVANQTMNELATLSLTLSASDSDLPAQTFKFGLVSGPGGLNVSPAGLVTWVPNEAQGPSTNTVVVQVTDSGSHALSATNQFQVIVREVKSNTPPTVVLITPLDGQGFDAPATILLRATASDSDGTIAKVEFFENGRPLGALTKAPFEWNLTQVAAGPYTLMARATDTDGASTDSAALSVTVREALSLKLTSPSMQVSYCPGAPLAFAAEAAGPLPSGSRVEFWLDNQRIALVDSVPYRVLSREELVSGSHEARARLLDANGAPRAETAAVRFTVMDACADVAFVINYADSEVERMVGLITEDLRAYVPTPPVVFDQRQAKFEELLGYKLIIWAGLDRTGEGLTDADVDLMLKLHDAGKSLYLIGPHLLSDTPLLSASVREQLQLHSGLRPGGPAVAAGGVETQLAGYGEPVCQGRSGVVDSSFWVDGGLEPGELTATNEFQVKVTLARAPVMVVSPSVCAPDLGQARIATQTFHVGDNPQSQKLFKNTVLWLMRAWYCQNLEFQLTAAQAPERGQVGEELVYGYIISNSGACGPVGLVLNEELPAGWSIVGVEYPENEPWPWLQVGNQLAVTMGCVFDISDQFVRLRLRPTRAGTFRHTVRVQAEAKVFNPEKHQAVVTTVIEGEDLTPPRLDLHITLPGTGLELWLLGAEGKTYRVQQSIDLRTWSPFDAATGRGMAPNQQVVLPLTSASSTARYFRAVWP